MKAKSMKTVTKRELQAFVDTMTSISSQCARMRALARGQGKTTVPAAEYWEMHDRFEKAAGAFLGEKRRLLESREAYFSRVSGLCAKPEEMLATMTRNGIQLRM